MKPQRIQLSRKRGFNLQKASRKLNGLPAVNCARPGRWGNPFVIQFDPHPDYSPQTADQAVKMFLDSLTPNFRKAIQTELHGQNLACWCNPDAPCHVDVLLEIANA